MFSGITFEYYNQGKNQSKLESGNLEKRIHDLFNLKEDELITTNEDTWTLPVRVCSEETSKKIKDLTECYDEDSIEVDFFV